MQPTKIIDNFSPLFSALNSKRPGKYHIESSPYVICVGVDDMTADEYEFSEALFGRGMARDVDMSWPMHGFFLQECKPVNTSVSAVLFCKTLKEFHLEDTRFSLWHNPFAKTPVDSSLFPVTQYFYEMERSRLVRNEIITETDLLKVLGIKSADYARFKHMELKQPPKN